MTVELGQGSKRYFTFSNLAIFGYGPGKIYLFIFLDITLPFFNV